MSEVILERIAKIVDEHSDIQSFSWASVHDALLRYEGIVDLQHEDVVMASGEGFAFAYSPYHYAPMYLGLMKCGRRLKALFGCSVKWLRGPTHGGSLEEAWTFIKENLDAGHGIHVEGPESFLIYGYKDPGAKEERILKCLARWGPGLDGDVIWEQFASFPALFSFSSIEKTDIPKPQEENIKMLIWLMQKYQLYHSGIGFKFPVHHEVTIEEMKGKEITLSKENYGLKGFEKFIKDVQDEKMVRGMLQAYLYCHGMNFQIWGRHWQSKWFKKQAKLYKGELTQLFNEVAEAYLETAKKLEEFVKINLANEEAKKLHEKIGEAIPSLKEAYEHEKKAVTTITKIADAMGLNDPISLDETIKETLYLGMRGGDTHIDPFIALLGLAEEDLQKKPAENVMSIWEQLTHMQFWQELILQNLKEGKPHWRNVDWKNYPPDYKAKYGSWEGFHKAICETITEIQQVIKEADDPNKRFPAIDNTSFTHLARVLCSHMSYHIAQVVMARKIFGLWPPPKGNFQSFQLVD